MLIWAFHVTFSSITYLLNMSFFCIGSISWYCFIVLLFHCSSHVPLFQFVIFKPLSHCFEETIGFNVKGYSVPRDLSWIENYKLIPWYSDCSVSVPFICQCSGVSPAFRCSAGVPCSVVPVFLVL